MILDTTISDKSKQYFEGLEDKFIQIYGSDFNYDKAIFKGMSVKIDIVCNNCGNITKRTPTTHIGKYSCMKCRKSSLRRNKTFYVSKFIDKYGDKYDYSKFEFNGVTAEINIKCNKHNITFSSTPNKHLNGHSCPKCREYIVQQKAYNKGYTNFWNNIKNSLNYAKNDYKETKYEHGSEYLTCKCKKCDIVYSQARHDHYINNFNGCPICGKRGFKDHLPAILYYISVNSGQSYKIGITNRTVSERYSFAEMQKIKIIKEWYYDIGKDAKEQEKLILEEFNYAKFKGDNSLKSGYTEMFDRDVLLLDTRQNHEY